MGQIATLIGATGLVGGEILKCLLADDRYAVVRLVGRRSLQMDHPKLEEHVIDLADQQALEQAIAGSETVFVSVGTTNRKVRGDKEAYRKVDFDIPVNAARAAAKYGVYGFALVSAVGADPDNNYNFYIKLKGVTEETVAEQMIPQTLVFRPSLLMGHRTEKRTAERIAQFLMPFVNLFLTGKLKRYRGIEASDVAKAMVTAACTEPKGIRFFEYAGMMELAAKWPATGA
jgi:uncharacterized protein YbjT (DUF2867 family)